MREGGRLTVDDPALYLGRGYLERRGYLCVGQVLPDVLESEIGEREQADFALELGGVQACIRSSENQPHVGGWATY